MSSSPWDYIAKLVCIGDSGCGKSSLTIRLCEGRFSPHHDVTIGTFQHVTDWLNDLRQIAEPDIVVILVGNKADLARQEKNEREVTREEAEEWAKRNGVMEYVETSAKSGENVEKAFMRVAERIYQNIQAGKYDLNDRRSGVKGPGAGNKGQVKVSNDPNQSNAGGCC
ncbi:unnamed protein product [Clonostachys rosea f. rosea IK726]|uniref:Uncharacterized protein n=2 Tax=Bionectria ochroleuca TaxID=29856 RepID=A0A0B7JLS8_BIOOC|nr:unnamed protein product [Clonostachys rosea f. rosea IK726]